MCTPCSDCYTRVRWAYAHVSLLYNMSLHLVSLLYNIHTCMHCCPGHLCSTCHNQRNKCTYTQASTPVRRYSNFFAMQNYATHLATWALPKKPSEFTPAHGTVAAALSHRHHLIIRFDAGPIQFVYGSYLKPSHGAYPSQNSISTIVFQGFPSDQKVDPSGECFGWYVLALSVRKRIQSFPENQKSWPKELRELATW